MFMVLMYIFRGIDWTTTLSFIYIHLIDINHFII